MNSATLKVIKIAFTAIGLGVNIVSTILSEKELDVKIAKAVSKAITHK